MPKYSAQSVYTTLSKQISLGYPFQPQIGTVIWGKIFYLDQKCGKEISDKMGIFPFYPTGLGGRTHYKSLKFSSLEPNFHDKKCYTNIPIGRGPLMIYIHFHTKSIISLDTQIL